LNEPAKAAVEFIRVRINALLRGTT